MTAPEVREAFATLRQLTPQIGHELLDVLERRLILSESLLALHERLQTIPDDLDADLIPFPDRTLRAV